jgi:hypothetical protein
MQNPANQKLNSTQMAVKKRKKREEPNMIASNFNQLLNKAKKA